METTIIVWGTLLLPLFLGILFKVGAPHLFFSIMAGELLARYFGHDVAHIAENSAKQTVSNTTGEIFLLIIPLLLTAFFMRKTIKTSQIILHVLPLAITGVVLAAFLFPLLSADLQNDLSNEFVGNWILNLNRSIIGVVVVLQIISLWLFNRHDKKSH